MKIKDLNLAFGNKIVLKDLNIEIERGEFVFIIGHSGSGKTSLIRSLIGDLEPKSGEIIMDDKTSPYNKKNSKSYIIKFRRKIGVIFQDYKLLESKKVYENVAFAMEVCGYSDRVIKERIPEVLQQVGLEYKKDKYISELSGGEKQRVVIARALVHKPDIIVGDEPTGNLDPETAESIMEIFNELHKDGKTIIIATHDKHIVDKFRKRVIAFKDKVVISDQKEGGYALGG